jgi:hypothetical protein
MADGRNLADLVNRWSNDELREFKDLMRQRMARMSTSDRQRALSSMEGISKLSDIVSEYKPTTQVTPKTYKTSYADEWAYQAPKYEKEWRESEARKQLSAKPKEEDEDFSWGGLWRNINKPFTVTGKPAEVLKQVDPFLGAQQAGEAIGSVLGYGTQRIQEAFDPRYDVQWQTGSPFRGGKMREEFELWSQPKPKRDDYGSQEEYETAWRAFVSQPRAPWGLGEAYDITGELAAWAGVPMGTITSTSRKAMQAGQMLNPIKPALGVTKFKPKRVTTKAEADALLKMQPTKAEKELTARATELYKPPLKPTAEVLATKVPEAPASMENIMARISSYMLTTRIPKAIQKQLRHKELGRRVAIAAKELEKGGEGAFPRAKRYLAGEMPSEFKPAMEILNPLERQMIENRIATFKLWDGKKFVDLPYLTKNDTWEAMQKILVGGKLPTDREVKLIQMVFGDEIAKALTKMRPFGQKAWEATLDILGLPKAFLASFDVSAPLRQGVIFAYAHPISSAKSLKPMFQALAKKKYSNEIYNSIITSKHADLYHRAKLYIAPIGETAPKIGTREEAFMTRWASKIPGISHSERAYNTYLNKLRSDVFNKQIDDIMRIGKYKTKSDIPIQQLENTAKWINWATGRGTLGPFEAYGAIGNILMFSPRFAISRLQVLTAPIALPGARKMATRDLATFFSGSATLLGLASLAGAKVELDPRSTNFAKMQVGATRIDVLGGLQPWSRFTAQVFTGKRKADSGNMSKAERWDSAMRMAQSKEAPWVGVIHDIIAGQTFIGEQMTGDVENIAQQFRNRLLPMVIQDMWDAFDEEGLSGVPIAASGVIGATVVSYNREWIDVRERRDELVKQNYGKYGLNTWDELGKAPLPYGGKAAQMELEKDPELTRLTELAEAESEKRWVKPETLLEQKTGYFKGVDSIGELYKIDMANAESQFKASGYLGGKKFREMDKTANEHKRGAYNKLKLDYPELMAMWDEGISQEDREKYSPQDLAYMEYVDLMYGDDMYETIPDRAGDYRYEEAERREVDFIRRHGLEIFDYIQRRIGLGREEEGQGKSMLREARKLLEPYWGIYDEVYLKYPKGTKEMVEKYQDLADGRDAYTAKVWLSEQPFASDVLRAMWEIETSKKKWRMDHPEAEVLRRLFY